jgi:hypothetical protein
MEVKTGSQKKTSTGRPFRKGADARRHILTIEEKQRGGRTTWARFMLLWRGQLDQYALDQLPNWMRAHAAARSRAAGARGEKARRRRPRTEGGES